LLNIRICSGKFLGNHVTINKDKLWKHWIVTVVLFSTLVV
jgi:hypothetical protein